MIAESYVTLPAYPYLSPKDYFVAFIYSSLGDKENWTKALSNTTGGLTD